MIRLLNVSYLPSQAKKVVSYAESSDEDDDPFTYGASTQARRRNKTRQVVQDDDEDDYGEPDGDVGDAGDDDDGTCLGTPPAETESTPN